MKPPAEVQTARGGPARELLRSVKYAAKRAGNFHRQGALPNVFLFSPARSGSTWLMELIASQPGFKFYDEPLNLRRHNVQKAGICNSWADLVPGGTKDDSLISYLKDLEKNRIPFMNPPPFRRNHRFVTNRIVFKLLALEHLIERVELEMGAKIVFLVRHPIPTTLSRKQLPRLNHFVQSERVWEKYLDTEKKAAALRIVSEGSDFEKGILSWCIQTAISLSAKTRDAWLTITYEELVLNPERCARLLCNDLQLKAPERMLKAMTRPAKNIALSGRETKGLLEKESAERNREIVTRWKSQISKEEEKRAFDIVGTFGLRLYEQNRFIAASDFLHFPGTAEMV